MQERRRPLASAASGSASASSGSHSTSMRSTASSAIARVRASTIATGCPCQSARPIASGGCGGERCAGQVASFVCHGLQTARERRTVVGR